VKVALSNMLKILKKNSPTIALGILSISLIAIQIFNIDRGFWPRIFQDEFINHRKIWIMIDSLLAGDWVHFFGSGVYAYGFIYWVVLMILNAPFIYFEQPFLMLLVPRLLNVAAILAIVVMMYRLLRPRLSISVCLLLMSYLFLMPANIDLIHASIQPGWIMTALLVASLYFLFRDQYTYKKQYLIGLAMMGLAIATKFQAIVAVQIIYIYIAQDFLTGPSRKSLRTGLIRILNATGMILFIYFLGNPYVIHPAGFAAIKRGVELGILEQSSSTASNLTQWWEILLKATHHQFFPVILFLAIVGYALYKSRNLFSRKPPEFIQCLSASFLVGIVYLYFINQMTASRYYLFFILVSVLILGVGLGRLKKNSQLIAITIILVSQFFFYGTKVVSRLGQKPTNATVTKQNLANEMILSALEGKTTQDTQILIDSQLGFDYQSLGLHYSQIHTSLGTIDWWMIDKKAFDRRFAAQGKLKVKTFKDKDILIISKDHLNEALGRFSNNPENFTNSNNRNKTIFESATIPIMSQLLHNKTPYRVLSENEHIIIFSK